jgi:cardiolipin synthase
VLGDLAFPLDLTSVRTVLIYGVGILTVASAAIYLTGWVRHMAAGEAASSGANAGRNNRDEAP